MHVQQNLAELHMVSTVCVGASLSRTLTVVSTLIFTTNMFLFVSDSSKHIIATVPSVDNLVGDLPVPSAKMDAPAEPAKEPGGWSTGG